MSEPQHPAPFGDKTGHHSGIQAEHAEGNFGKQPGARVGANQGGNLDSIVAVGAALTQLREAKHWSIDDVSARLKVSPQKLRELELGDISHLPDRTFAAGIVRSYAKMLGADPEPFTQALRRANGPLEQNLSLPASSGAGLPRGRVSVPLGSAPRRRSWLWGVAAVVVALLALAMWHTGGDSSAWLARLKASAHVSPTSTASEATVAASSVATPDEIAAANTGEAASAGTPGATPSAGSASEPGAAVTIGGQPMPRPLGTNAQPASSSTIAAVQNSPASTPAVPSSAAPASAAAVAGSGSNALQLSVTQDSWFSVRQNDGKEVFSGLVHGGSSQRVQGDAPFKVTVGNKAGLQSMTFDGKNVDPAKYADARGNVARFSLP